ncbi:hypothetical protein D3C81_1211630 [compost metagenome]
MYQPLAHADQQCGNQRQALPGVGELFGELGHHEGHQADHHGKRHAHQHTGVDQRGTRLVLLPLHLLQVIGQPREHLGQAPGPLACFDQRTVKAAERRPLARQATCQPQAFGERAAQGHQHAVQGRLAQLPFEGGQGIDQRNARTGQGRQLAGQFAQLCAVQALAAGLPGTCLLALQLAGEQALLT